MDGSVSNTNANLTFPLELWRRIFRYATSQSDLARAARICRSLRHEAEAALYTSPSVGPDIKSVLVFCQIVPSCSRRASTVRTLKVYVDTLPDTLDRTDVPGTFARALRALANIERLRLDIHDKELTIGCLETDVLGVQFPTLRRLSTNFPVHPALLRGIRSNAQIEQLKILAAFPQLEWHTPDSEPLIELPSLRVLTCQSPLLRHLARPTPVTHLYMPDYLLHELPTVATLFGHTLVSLRLGMPKMLLGAPGPSWSLNEVAENFPRLKSLRIDEYQRISNLEGRGFVWDTSPAPQTLNKPTKLTLVWVAKWQVPDPPESEYQEFLQATVREKASKLLEHWSPYLRRVVFWYDGDLYAQTFTSFVLDPDGQVTVGHEHDLKVNHWKRV